MTRLDKITAIAGQTVIDFVNIPSGYSDLMLVGCGQGRTLDVFGSIVMNGDRVAANYSANQSLTANGSTVAAGTGAATTEGIIVIALGGLTSGGSNLTNLASVFKILIPQYAGTIFFKRWLIESAEARGTNANNWLDYSSAYWKSTAAVNRVTVLFTQGSQGSGLLAGSVFTLYGLG